MLNRDQGFISNINKEPPRPIDQNSSFESLEKDRELAEYAKDQIIYTGLFIDPKNLYEMFPPKLDHSIRDPHVTVAFRPDSSKVLLDSLGSNAKIEVVGYGNDGQNEGLLVNVKTDDPAIQKALDNVIEPDKNGELKHIPTHITLSIANGAKAVDTRNLEFQKIDNPVSITGSYRLFGKNGSLINDKNTLEEMKNTNLATNQEVEPDKL